MKVLIGCEFSGAVRNAFAAMGHDAWSCDLLPAESDGQHIQGDVFEAVNRGSWDIIVLHPPCTALGLCGNARYGRGMPKHAERLQAIRWTSLLWDIACQRARVGVAMENPKNVMGPVIGKRTQVVHPWQFGHPEQKETWLWLHGLKPLTPTNDVYGHMMTLPKKERERIHYMSPSARRGHERSITFSGIAQAMAQQWG